MPLKSELQYPFITRQMLSFEHGVEFKLKLTTQTDDVATITVRGMTREGIFTFSAVTDGLSSPQTFTFAIPDIPIMVSVLSDTSGLLQGQCFATLALMANSDVLNTLCSGFIYGGKGISWPSQNIADQTPGRGLIFTEDTADPAAGSNFSINVPTGETWRIHAIQFRFVTSATVASRRVRVRATTGQLGFGIVSLIQTDQTASTTLDYSCAPYGQMVDEIDSSDAFIIIPNELWVVSGGSISSSIRNIQAGDQVSNVELIVEKFFANG